MNRILAVAVMLVLSFSVLASADNAPATSQPAREVDQMLQAQLDRKIPELKMDAVAFSDVIDFLRDLTGANIVVNQKALEAAGVDRNVPVNLRVRDASFATALQLILDDINGPDKKLGFKTKDGVIVISSMAALNLPTAKEYDIQFLLPHTLSDKDKTQRVMTIMKLIKGTVAPDSWNDQGAAACTIKESGGVLTVAQGPANQELIGNLLTQLRDLVSNEHQ